MIKEGILLVLSTAIIYFIASFLLLDSNREFTPTSFGTKSSIILKKNQFMTDNQAQQFSQQLLSLYDNVFLDQSFPKNHNINNAVRLVKNIKNVQNYGQYFYEVSQPVDQYFNDWGYINKKVVFLRQGSIHNQFVQHYGIPQKRKNGQIVYMVSIDFPQSNNKENIHKQQKKQQDVEPNIQEQHVQEDNYEQQNQQKQQQTHQNQEQQKMDQQNDAQEQKTKQDNEKVIKFIQTLQQKQRKTEETIQPIQGGVIENPQVQIQTPQNVLKQYQDQLHSHQQVNNQPIQTRQPSDQNTKQKTEQISTHSNQEANAQQKKNVEAKQEQKVIPQQNGNEQAIEQDKQQINQQKIPIQPQQKSLQAASPSEQFRQPVTQINPHQQIEHHQNKQQIERKIPIQNQQIQRDSVEVLNEQIINQEIEPQRIIRNYQS